tara:strand:+ start:178 stop:1017 length:840 start_codon:yes stop_codon:yes gene_type:complete
MKNINSLSGGKTSSYLAVHYPADYNLFALVCNEDKSCAHPDKKVMQLVNDKLQKYSARFGECIGTPENYLTLNVILDLEQKLGTEIIWLRDNSFDWWIDYKKGLPNQSKRWCTEVMKLKPIFEWCYLYTKFPVNMRIGYRLDEIERMDRLTTTYKLPVSCNNYGQKRQNWSKDIEWRVGDFPLIDDKILHYAIYLWSLKSGLKFPEDSNCQMCFNKQPQQLRKNFDDAPNVMNWAKSKETKTKRRFTDAFKMNEIERIGLQTDFVFGTGSGCSSGGCSD